DTSGLTSGTNYYVKLLGTDGKTIQLSLTSGGAAVTLGTSAWGSGASVSVLKHTAVQMSTVTFSAFENLTGNLADDTFVLNAGQGVTGFIDGGDGATSIDYCAASTAVTANLGLASAGATTGAGGGVRNSGDVKGGAGPGDTLLGPNLDA